MKSIKEVILVFGILVILAVGLTFFLGGKNVKMMAQVLNPQFKSVLERAMIPIAQYTPSTDTICNGNVCTKTLWSGVRNVYEDGIWKKIENAKSLKTVWNKVYLEKDPDFDIDVLEVNYTNVLLNLSFNSANWSAHPECMNSKVDDIKCDFKLTVKEEVCNEAGCWKEEINFQYKFQEKNGIKEDLKFSQKGNPLGKEFKFGGNSTTITLQDANTENLDDDSEGGIGTATSWYFDDDDSPPIYYSVIKFNISSIPISQTILDAVLILNVTSDLSETDDIIQIYSLLNNTWNEEVGFNYTKFNCNYLITGVLQDTFINPVTASLVDFNVTQWVSSEYNNGRYNVNFGGYLVDGVSDTGDDYTVIKTKEYTSVSARPYLNITYEGGADSTPPTFTAIANITKDNVTAVYYDINATDTSGLGSFWINDTTNFKINITSGVFENNTQLSVQLYWVNVSVNDTLNNVASQVIWVNITEYESPPSNCWTKTGSGRGSILYIPRGCAYQVNRGTIGG